MYKTLTGKELQRAEEVLDAYVARRGPVTLDSPSYASLVGRAVGLVLTGYDNMQDPHNVALGAHLMRLGRDQLLLLGVSLEDSTALVKAMANDLKDLHTKGPRHA